MHLKKSEIWSTSDLKVTSKVKRPFKLPILFRLKKIVFNSINNTKL